MPSLRAEHEGIIGIRLMIYDIQTYIGIQEDYKLQVGVWIDNAEVLEREWNTEI